MSINDYTKHPLSWMPEKKQISRPEYLSIAALLENDIQSGNLIPGTKLPPQRELADYLDFNFTTITRAYNVCRERGLIYGVTGRGTFVAPLPGAEKPADHVYEMGVVLGFPSLTKPIVDSACEIINRDYLERLFSYTERVGLERHRAAGKIWMAESGVHTDTDHIAVFAGAQNAITVALLSLFNVGDKIAVDAFTYANLIGAAKLAHISLVAVVGDSCGMKPDKLDEICKKSSIAGIFLMPNCANPTTITMPENRRDEIAQVCKKHHLIVIEDDASPMPSPDRQSFFSRLPEQTIYIAASTRHLAAGLRITFAAFPDSFKNQLLRGFYHTSIKASALDAEIISQLIISGKARTLLEEKYQLAAEACKVFDQVFPKTKSSPKAPGYFRLLPLADARQNGQELEQILLANGLSVCHSYRFAVEKNPKSAFLRISLSSTPHMDALKNALLRLKSALSKLET